jgi:hypothetical protein
MQAEVAVAARQRPPQTVKSEAGTGGDNDEREGQKEDQHGGFLSLKDLYFARPCEM